MHVWAGVAASHHAMSDGKPGSIPDRVRDRLLPDIALAGGLRAIDADGGEQ
jgi:hypothetical protein